MPNPTSARPDWTFDPRKPEAERTLKADQIKEYLLTDAVDLEVENAVIAVDAICSGSYRTHEALLTLYRERFSEQIETAESGEILAAWREGRRSRTGVRSG